MPENEKINPDNQKVILASGGIVQKKTKDGLKILIILRSRYGEEWCLPKGKLESGESLGITAIREVKEETGVVAKIVELAGTTHYKVGNEEKIVVYWNMGIDQEGTFQSSEEVRGIEWVTPSSAIKKLTHDNERELVSKLILSEALTLYPLKGFWGWFHKGVIRHQHFRLAREIKAYRATLEYNICKKSDPANSCWLIAAENLVDQAEKALSKFDIDEGWTCLHAAKRMGIQGFSGEELKQWASVLRGEASKLKKWRKETVYYLIGNPENLTDAEVQKVNHDSLRLASLIRDEEYQNKYFEISLRRSNFYRLFIVVFVSVALLPIFAGLEFFPDPLNNWKTLIAVVFFGVLGATFSVGRMLSVKSLNGDIPDQIIGTFVTWMRPAIGALSAIAVYIFVQGDILKPVISAEFQSIVKGNVGVLGLAFIAGFSERLVIKTIEKVSGK
jgi:8-oxo-dGTP diphosphatase